MSKAQPQRERPGGNSGIDEKQKARTRAYVSRVERLDEEIAALNADKADVYAEAKGTGEDVPNLKKAIARRRMDPEKRERGDAALVRYEAMLEDLPPPARPKKKGGK